MLKYGNLLFIDLNFSVTQTIPHNTILMHINTIGKLVFKNTIPKSLFARAGSASSAAACLRAAAAADASASIYSYGELAAGAHYVGTMILVLN